jgi:hypothetical protein
VSGRRTLIVEARLVPLFPLHTVLFRDGVLPLRIFEPRYVDMVGRCLREQGGFVVVLIRSGAEARIGAAAEQPSIFDIGTYAEITDFSALPNGVLGIVACGRRTVRIERTQERHDHLLEAEVTFLPDEPEWPLPAAHAPLADLLARLLEHPGALPKPVTLDLRDGRAVSWRLAELLPVAPEIRQSLLKLHHPRERMVELQRLIDRLTYGAGTAPTPAHGSD